ncbi:MAG: MFS family permease [Francisellaceae bacterium]|jgi:MFS family permease
MTKQGKMFLAILLILSMELIDVTVLNNIIADIAHSLKTDVFHANLAITSYMISFGIFMPISVWLSTKFGSRNPMIYSLVGFIATSVLCGLAFNLEMLVVFRILQGFFAALLLPISQTTMIRLSSSMVDVSAKIGIYTVASAAIGQLVGAFLTQYLSWRLVFFLNAPIGLYCLYLVLKYFYVPFERKLVKLDIIGFVVVGVSTGLLFTVSNLLGSKSTPVWLLVCLTVIPILICSIYFLNLKRIVNPILKFKLFRNRNFSLMLTVIMINKLTLYWLYFAFPVYLYLFIGFRLTTVAVIMVCLWAGNLFSKKFTVFSVRYLGMKAATIVASFGLLIIMLTWGYTLHSRQLITLILVLIPFFGIMMGIFQTATNSYVLAVVVDEDKADSNVLSRSLLMIATAFSISFLGAAYECSKIYLSYENEPYLFIWAFEYSFIISGIIQFLASFLVIFTDRGTSRLA